MPTPKYDIVVGVDFGTTASAIGYSSPLLGRPYYRPILIKQPGIQNGAEKIPSVLTYTQDNPNLQERVWGFSAEYQPNAISWFKLFLDGDNENEIASWEAVTIHWARSLGILSLPSGMSPIDVISDYLVALKVSIWNHLKEKLTRADKSLETSTIRFCFTIPGYWSQEAKDDMLIAIKRAGFGSRDCDNVCLLTESGAAIIFALSNLRRGKGSLDLITGDGVLVCDCGGGTVDIASFLISEQDPLVYDQLTTSLDKLSISGSLG
ncbi:uncharacterized protein N7483_008952 [Penicillium malachiteum]|uniref:uncharacterized protein n=1 Tax=Penicillium malachiteum TaxID=1324776 RepID=UPI002547A0C1|nr:uncharacterized protein N7483_008952 [Penicillium malachiteum]KAJ5721018.1 hypothetical protein N7483_008952 [Penicillium malachiteum]